MAKRTLLAARLPCLLLLACVPTIASARACRPHAAPLLAATRWPQAARPTRRGATRMRAVPPIAELRPLLAGDVAVVFTLHFAHALASELSRPDFAGWTEPPVVDNELGFVLAAASCDACCWLVGGALLAEGVWTRSALATPLVAVGRVARSWLPAANARVAIALAQTLALGRESVDPVEVASGIAWLLIGLGSWRLAVSFAIRRR
jgi:hypothetical protein